MTAPVAFESAVNAGPITVAVPHRTVARQGRLDRAMKLPMEPGERIVVKTDADLVATIRSGDPSAWGTLFDRHRETVWRIACSVVRNPDDSDDVVQATFLKAVESISQLRDPAKVRPWLLSIARATAMDRVRRRREFTSDAPPELVDGDSELGRAMHQEDVAALVTAAFDGLEPRDRVALELVERQALSGEELAETLGLTRENAYALVHNARQRFTLSVESVVVARTGRADCAGLGSLLGDWDGELTPLLRKRIVRHVDRCDTCSQTRDREVTPASLMNLVPVLAMPAVVAERTRAAVLEAATSESTAVSGGASASASMISKSALVGLGVVTVGVVAVGSMIAAGVLFGGGSTDRAAATAITTTDRSAVASPAGGVSASTTAPSTIPEPAYCELAAELSATSAGGPSSGSPGDLEAYLVGTNRLLQQLAEAPEATAATTAYAGAYQRLVDAEVWETVPVPSSPELVELRDTVEAEIAVACPAG